MHMLRRDADRAFRLGMAFFADIDNLAALRDLFMNQVMSPRNVGTGSIYSRQPFVPCLLAHLRRHAVRREDHRASVNLIQNVETVAAV
ncbi:hypothetical protein D3C71_1578070 [compost metagenome]